MGRTCRNNENASKSNLRDGNRREQTPCNTSKHGIRKKDDGHLDALEMKYNMPIKLKSVGHPDETLEKIDIWDSGG